ncbi:enoyl-CoA hydratase [Aureibaculum algae]|uniref:Enoyl-CoA hydratase n=1 Tax=Aureibaculum algae TaxID=2584122 RepID=A0A5B7TUT9_9FLAO|nr:enoyl-CoA hydratase-related protein [Aureibaculum algae]QCX40629.1 enoyl-CoA hydratase [Aureibaculum algae]
MSYNNILIEQDDNITTITINRPSKLNALNRETLSELHNAFVEIEGDKTTRVIILTGSGEKAFVAGADISEFSDFEVKEGTALAKQGQKLVFDFIENLSIPVIAAINGFALGGGLELAMACHFRIASDNAKMGLPETSLGVIPGYGGTQRLPQLVGKGKAMEMIMTARMINADEALKVGLVNYTVTQEELLPLAENLASKIIQNSPLAIASAIKAVNAGFKDGVNGYDKEIKQFGKCFGTDDFTEGTTAFLEKRKANF